MAHEVWRDVVGYEGFYQVSNLGNVKSLCRKIKRGKSLVTIHEKMLNQTENTNGYLRVSLSRNGMVEMRFVHRLVAEAFIDKPNDEYVVDHIDGNKQNNNVLNLRWCSQGQNLHYSYAGGRRRPLVISDEWRKRQKRAVSRPVIRSDGKEFESVLAASRALGLCDAAVSQVVHGRAKTAGGYSFRFKE